ncbi:MAG TPA: glutamate 5-kinase [Candidatus Thermoplasmatota archaeon]|nr:glutamate 5-kinase [Candidatus Thermoplasmatota archaeon]
MPAKRRIVVKIGTNTICGDLGRPDPWYMATIADEMLDLVDAGHQVILVTSGAIGTGRHMLGLHEKPRDVRVRQAAAAVGQPRLMQDWAAAFARRGRPVGQVLLTYHTFARRESYLHMRAAMLKLLEMNVVPIVNENDTVSISEIDAGFGDNDRLSALVATKLEADLLVILSDVKGLYTKAPGEPGAELVPIVREVDDRIRAMASAKTSSGGRGGMASKLDAAALAMENGTEVVIAPGREAHILRRIAAGEAVGTRFVPQARATGARRWLLLAKAEGEVHVDAGAARALAAGKHLLPAGVVGVKGQFDVESVVAVVCEGKTVARAVSELSSDDIARVQGLKTLEARAALAIDGPVNVTSKGNVLLLDEK